MVRPALVLAIVAAAGAARAADLPGHFGMYPAQGAPLAMLDTKLDVQVRGPIVETTVTQTFRNDTDRATEATYIFPLPADAAVSAMAITTGARTIHASIEARDKAAERYEKAVAAGLGAGLLDQERPDVFTQIVSAIPAHGTVSVTLRYDTVAVYRDGAWELALPLVVAPRYVPGSASGRPTTGTGRAPDTDRAPDASRVTPGGAPGAGGATQIAIAFADAVDDVTSPTHTLTGDRGRYAIVDHVSDHDAIVRWRAHVPAEGWVEQDEDGGYAAVMLQAPPAAPRKGALRMLLVLDRSVTTRGDGELVERPLVRALLGALDSKDVVSVIGSDAIDARDPHAISAALDAQWGRATGALDLARTLGGARAGGAAVVLVSDGLVADDAAVIAAAKKLGAPIHVIGVGPAPNRALLAAIARETGGTLRFAVVGDPVAPLAQSIAADLASPPPPLSISWGTLAASDIVPAQLPRLGAGQAALVLARVAKVQAANARASGEVFGFTTVTVPKPPLGATSPRGALARRWARMKLDELIAKNDTRALTAHALRYGLVSPVTSMVAIGDEVVVQGGVKHTVAVPVSVPAGMRWQEVKRATAVDTTISEKAPLAKDERPPTHAGKADTHTASKPGHTSPKKGPARDREDLDDDRKSKQPKTAAEPPATGTFSADTSGGEGGRDDDGNAENESRPREAPAPTVATAAGAQYDETLSVENFRAQPGRVRLTLGLTGGASVIAGNADAFGGLSLRADVGRRLRYGGEASVWLVGGLHAEGSLLASLSSVLTRHLELSFGLGLRVTGIGSGPALGASLHTPLTPRLSGFLRYDGAILLRDAGDAAQHAGSVGIETSF